MVTFHLFSAQSYTAAALPHTALSLVQTLFERCADYFEVVEGGPPGPHAAEEVFTDVAPGKTLDDKLLLGLWDGPQLIGVLDVMRDYPDANTWFIGLLLLDPAYRGHGAGALIIEALVAWAAQQGVQALGLGVVAQNTGALRFWSRMGFEVVRVTEPRTFGTKEQTVTVMRRNLLCWTSFSSAAASAATPINPSSAKR